jgi:Na+/H+ antiporter NhaD/arsenite permease-like protein
MGNSNRKLPFILFLTLLGCLLLGFYTENPPVNAQTNQSNQVIFGEILDLQNTPVEGVLVSAESKQGTLGTAISQPDGHYAIELSSQIPASLEIVFERAHFQKLSVTIEEPLISKLKQESIILLPQTILERKFGPAFWIATAVFIAVLILIATGRTHNTLAALIGASVLYAISYLLHPLDDSFFIFDFAGSIAYIDWNVIFLIMGMMMYIAIVEHTGIFQWMAFFAYKISKGRMYILLPILMFITGVASAFLDNVTTMLLMTPITVQIALSVGINPLALLMPEVMASNVVGVSTLVGTPTNILIGSFANISFNGFLRNQTPGVLLAFTGLIIYSIFSYKKELNQAKTASETLMSKLEESGKITHPVHLKKAGWIGLGMLFLFIFGERIHLLPSVTALIGATALLLWIRPNIEEMIEAVDWTTLVFFMSLFIVVGAVQEVGLISLLAGWIGDIVGENLFLAMFAITWLSAILSMIIANIPFTAAILPVVAFLSTSVPGADEKVLFFCLSVGAALGGNGSLIGASANMVTAGIADAAGYKISYSYFMKKGVPAVLITVSLGFIWLLIRFH